MKMMLPDIDDNKNIPSTTFGSVSSFKTSKLSVSNFAAVALCEGNSYDR